MTLLEPHNLPFAIAMGLMVLLALVQVLGLGDWGVDADLDVDPDIGADADASLQPGMVEGLLTLLGMGRVPLTIWLALFLLMFAGIGLSVQELATSLIGRRATITDGVARTGSPARARVRDVHGQAHYVMVEPHEQSSELHSGDEVLLVRREKDQFYATALAERRLSPN